MRPGLTTAIVLGCGVLLLTGCVPSSINDAGTVASRLDDVVSGKDMITRFAVSPGDVSVVVRDRGQLSVRGSDLLNSEALPSGATTLGVLDTDAIDAQYDRLMAGCQDSPVLRGYVAMTGTVVVSSWCGSGDESVVLESTLDGEPGINSSDQVDFLSAGGLDLFLRELRALAPGTEAFMVSLPGPASARGASVVMHGKTWTQPDGTDCHVGLGLNGAASPHNPRVVTCLDKDPVVGKAQEFTLTGIDAEKLHSELSRILDSSGFPRERVAYVGLYCEEPGSQEIEVIVFSDREERFRDSFLIL